MSGLPEYPTLADLESYQFEVTRERETVHYAELAYAGRLDLAEQQLRKHYLHSKNPPWVSYQLIRVSHWNERAGRWHGRKVRGAVVRREMEVRSA